MELKLGDLTIRALTTADADLLVDATRSEHGTALWGPRPIGPYSAADATAALRSWDRDGHTSYGILAGEHLVGALGLMPDAPGSAELAYWVRPEQRGRSIATRTLAALTTWALAGGGLTRVWLEINPTNTASQRVAERAGFAYEQRIRHHCREWIADDPAQDAWHDCLIWARHPKGFAGPHVALLTR